MPTILLSSWMGHPNCVGEEKKEGHGCATRHLAMSLHLGKWEDCYLMIGTAYFDASGKKESPVLAVAGFFAPINEWIRFEIEWKRCLAIYGTASLHMKDYAHSTGEYRSWKGDEKLRARFLGDLIRIIRERVDDSFATGVHMHEYNAVNEQYKLREWAHPYALCGLNCLDKVKKWAWKFKYDFSLIDYVFEDGDEGKGNLSNLAAQQLSINPVFKSKAHSVAFEAADLIAYEYQKANNAIIHAGDNLLAFDELRIPLQKFASIPGSAEWSLMSQEDMVKNCEKFGISKR